MSNEDGEVKLFDLRDDPFELADVSGEQPEEVERHKAILTERLAEQRARHEQLGRASSREVDPATLEELRSLGYIVEE